MRLIDADALKDRFKLRIDWLKKDVHDECSKGLFWGAETDVDLIDEMPTVDAEPVKHGRWKTVPYRSVEHGNVVVSGEVEMCTNCRCARKEFHKQMNYCPNCGAKMDEETKHENE